MTIREAAAEMLILLESSRLEVVLVPQKRRTNEGGMIRVAITKNAAWYSRFCALHQSSRKRRNLASDTRIKRAQTIRALRAITRAKSALDLPSTVYVERLMPRCVEYAKQNKRRVAA